MKELQRFLSYLKFERRFSVHTLIAYETDIEQFLSYINEQYQLEDFTQVNHLFIRSWVVSQMEMKLNPRSVNRKITALRSFFRFLLRENVVSANPMIKIRAPKVSQRLPEYVDEQRMEIVLNEKHDESSFVFVRNQLIMEFFYMTGVRLSELLNLRASDVDLYNLTVTVTGKRNKVRQIPVTNSFRRKLEAYLELRNQLLTGLEKTDDYFFIGNKGNKLYPKFVYRIVQQELTKHSEITNSKKSPHILRHSFATAMLNKGADINAIKTLLGHSSLAATQVYTHNTIEKLKDIYKQAFPKA